VPDFPKVIERSRGVAGKMNKGVEYLMKKNKIDVVFGHATFTAPDTLEVKPSTDMDGKQIGTATTVKARHIIIATGARAREIPPLPVDGKRIITYKEAMLQTEKPGRLVVVGAGAIGVEFAYVYHHMGTRVTVIEVMDRLVPVEDADVSKELEKSYKKAGIGVMTNAQVQGVEGKYGALKVKVKTAKGEEIVECDQVLSAVGVVGNVEDLGLEKIGVKHERGSILTDEWSRTGVKGVYAIGDVAGAPWLAHKASHEGILCVEKIAVDEGRADLHLHPLDKGNIPGCTYCQPQIGSVGMTEKAAKEAGREVKVGKFPFSASGKASAIGHTEGFVKVIYDAKYGELLGCHIIGAEATELIAEAVTARTLETTAHEIMEAVHPHPTLSEAVMEATKVAYGIPMNI
jgi:dihydrolipoamide dehydrogenase